MIGLLLTLSQPARADDATSPASQPPAISTSLLRPAPDARRALALPTADVSPGWTARADLQLLYQPLVYLYDDGHSAPVLNTVTQLDLGASWGVGNLRLAGTAPAILNYDGETGLTGSALGDPALELKVALLPQRWDLGLAVLGGLGFPLGAWQVGLGEEHTTGQAALLVDGEAGPLWLAAQGGARFRPAQAAGDLELDDNLVLRAAAALGLGQRTDLAAELLTETALAAPFADYRTSPTELLLSASHRRDSGLLLRAGVGLGLVAGPGAPAWRLLVGVGQDSPQP